MIQPLKETIQLHKDQKTTQILLLNYVKLPNPVLKEHRGTKGFGSIKVISWTHKKITKKRAL